MSIKIMNSRRTNHTKCITVLLITILFVHQTESNSCNFNVKLTQTLENEGFHRNLTYEIEYGGYEGNERWYDGCSVGLEQTLPAGLYASPDEINGLRYKTTTVFKSNVNTELPAEQASSVTMHLLGSVRRGRTHMALPVHARYHQAVAGGSTVNIEVPPPKLFLNCGKRLQHCSSDTAVNSFCPPVKGHKCLWREVPVMVSDPLRWHVPRGNTEHLKLVLFATAAVVALASAHLANEVHCFKLRQSRKDG